MDAEKLKNELNDLNCKEIENKLSEINKEIFEITNNTTSNKDTCIDKIYTNEELDKISEKVKYLKNKYDIINDYYTKNCFK